MNGTPSEPVLPLLASLSLGAVGLLVLGAQPLLYGSYVHEGRVSEEGLGLLAAIEIAAIATGSAGSAGLLGKLPARLVALAGIALTVAGNFLPVAVPLMLARGVSGFGGGLLVGIAAGIIARRSALNAAAATFLFLQAVSQYAILQWFSVQGGALSASSVQQSLAVIAMLSILVLPLVPARIVPSPSTHDQGSRPGMPPLAGLIALGASGLLVGAVVGIWAYMGLWLETRGIPAAAVPPMLTASMVGQMVGAVIAIGIGDRGRSGLRVIGMAMLLLGVVGWLLLAGAGGPLGWGLIVGFGVIWMIATPALTGFVLEADPTRRSLPFAASAQLLGAAVVPTLAGLLIAGSGIDTALIACAIALAISLVLILAALAASARRTTYAA